MTYDCASAPIPDEIEWKMIEAGDWETTDGRFNAYTAYDRIYGYHWILVDRTVDDFYKSRYHENTLKECIGVAKTIVKQEKEFRHEDQVR